MRVLVVLALTAVTSAEWTEKERRLGAHVSAEIEKLHPRFESAELTGYLNRMAARLSPVPVDVVVIETDEALARNVPGGRVYISTGLIARQPEELALAWVLAHQNAHLALGFTRAEGGVTIYAGGMCRQFQPAVAPRNFGSYEVEADRYAAEYVARAGYRAGDSQAEFELMRALVPRPRPRPVPTLRRAGELGATKPPAGR
jgi:predicted Zn-dependent protease